LNRRLEQSKRRGRRLSIIGFLQPLISFVYGLMIVGVSRKSYIQMMQLEAAEARKSVRIRVIVQDNEIPTPFTQTTKGHCLSWF
jgi:putative transposase